jgi:hypothetical protein
LTATLIATRKRGGVPTAATAIPRASSP